MPPALPKSFILSAFLTLCLCLVSPSAAQTVLHSWRMGEDDPAPETGQITNRTNDGVGSSHLEVPAGSNTPPVYYGNTPGANSLFSLQPSNAGGLMAPVDSSLGSSSSFFLELWFRTSGAASGTESILRYGTPLSAGFDLLISGSNFRLRFAGGAEEQIGTFTPGQWTHVAIVYDAGSVAAYVDGALTHTRNQTMLKPLSSDTFFIKGGSRTCFAFGICVDGPPLQFDEIRLATFPAGTFTTAMLQYPASQIQTGGNMILTLSGSANYVIPQSSILLANSDNATTSYSGVLSGPGQFRKAGSGTLTLSGASTFEGAATISTGTLALGANEVLPDASPLNIFAGASLALAGYTETAGPLSGSGSVTLGAGTLRAGGSASSNFGGMIIGSGRFVKSGGGALNCNGSLAPEGGISVKQGTLLLNVPGIITHPLADLLVGDAASGTFTINDGSANVGWVKLGPSGGAGVLTMNGGSLIAKGIVRESGNSSCIFNGGTLLAAGNSAEFFSGFTPGSATIAANGLFLNTSGFEVRVEASLSGPGTLIKQGAGRLILSGSNSYTGTWVNGGTLEVASGGGILHPASELNIGRTANGSFEMTGGSVTASQVNLGYNGMTTFGTLSLKGGTLTTGSILRWNIPCVLTADGGTIKAGSDTSALLAGFTSGSATIQAGGLTIDTDGHTVTVPSEFTGPGGIRKSGAGTLILSGASAYTGITTVNAGTLVISGSNTFSGFILNGGILDPGGSARTVQSMVMNGGSIQNGIITASNVTVLSGIFTPGSVIFAPGAALTVAAGAGCNLAGGSGSLSALSGEGSLALGTAAFTVGANDQSSAFAGSITGTGIFNKGGNGTFTLSGASSFTGTTNVLGGALAFASGAEFNAPASSIVVASTGTGALLMNGGSAAVDSVIIGHDGGTATVTLNGGTLTTNEIARWSVPSTIAFNGGTLRAAGNTSVLLNGFTNGSAVIQSGGLVVDTNGFTVSTPAELSGSGTLTKTGAGTLTLNGAYAHAGATVVNAGTLSLTSARLADNGGVTIAAGATLDLAFTGTDTINALTLSGVTYAKGTWGRIGSGAEHETSLITGTGRLQVVNEFAAWLSVNGFPAGTAAGDEDRDGLTNLDEYYSGSHPGQGNGSTTTAVHAPGVIEVTFDRRKGIQTVSAVVEWSVDMSTWSTAGVSAPQVIADQGSTERLRVTVPRPETVARRYVRVRPVMP